MTTGRGAGFPTEEPAEVEVEGTTPWARAIAGPMPVRKRAVAPANWIATTRTEKAIINGPSSSTWGLARCTVPENAPSQSPVSAHSPQSLKSVIPREKCPAHVPPNGENACLRGLAAIHGPVAVRERNGIRGRTCARGPAFVKRSPPEWLTCYFTNRGT